MVHCLLMTCMCERCIVHGFVHMNDHIILDSLSWVGEKKKI